MGRKRKQTALAPRSQHPHSSDSSDFEPDNIRICLPGLQEQASPPQLLALPAPSDTQPVLRQTETQQQPTTQILTSTLQQLQHRLEIQDLRLEIQTLTLTLQQLQHRFDLLEAAKQTSSAPTQESPPISAPQPAAGAASPRVSYAAAAAAAQDRAPPAAAPAAPAAGRPHRDTAHGRRSAMVESLPYRRSFIYVAPSSDSYATSCCDPASCAQFSIYCQIPALEGRLIEDDDAVRLDGRLNPNQPGPHWIPLEGAPASVSIHFTAKTQELADELVRERHALKGKPGYGLFDVLSPNEKKAHAALWPLFKAARARGQRAQFNRARLKIDGKEVFPPRY
jgi:hypothetical protein